MLFKIIKSAKVLQNFFKSETDLSDESSLVYCSLFRLTQSRVCILKILEIYYCKIPNDPFAFSKFLIVPKHLKAN